MSAVTHLDDRQRRDSRPARELLALAQRVIDRSLTRKVREEAGT